MAVPNPIEALIEADCPHLDRHKVLCLRCAADAVRPAADDLAAQLRAAERDRDALRARLEELITAARPVVARESSPEPVEYQVPRGPVERARAVLETPPPAYPVTGGPFIIVHDDEDWETAARDADRRAAISELETAAATTRAVEAAQRAAEALQRARDAEADNVRVERAVRELLAEWLEDELLTCPYGHEGAPVDCGWCWSVKATQTAIAAVRRQFGPTSAAVRRRARNLDNKS